ncbi:rod shape-determining protein MreC [Paenactinomyces guangxiensis]|uniref:Cell shape-determining protein MreC n=1 Tax=Paenactinomyces guangxiensis TaxID=1490290 RepID=A0A7W1WU79_9BACL|nr:rod shape-determining protein MreC [Paenactinomyces guangxiensis]MBA4496155.1 rod shape-determining protein MreC [Paenactinomyces guangxiensis]MBH8593243.1 rod shape-determining protein MreC [Paenactinomyces guangxiensis]
MFGRFFIHRRLILLLLSIILVIFSVSMTRGDRGEMMWPESWIKNGVTWIQGLFYQPVYALVSSFTPEKKSQPEDSSQQLLQLQAQVMKLQQENQELKKLIGYQKENKVTYIPARVVYRSPDRWNNRVVINRGSDDGVLSKMPIITSQGLIGRVQSVTGHMADIQLLTDSGNGPGIAAVIKEQNKETLGIIEGYDAEKKRLIMKKIPASAKPQKGQLVVTSRLSEIYTGDLLIGTVDRVEAGEFGVDQMVYVKPSATFERLDFVMVVRDPAKLQLKQHQQQDAKTGSGGKRR